MRLLPIALLLLTASVIPGCGGDRPPADGRRGVRLELLSFDGCPNTPVMRARLVEALRRLDLPGTVVDVDLASLTDGDPRRGFGAPTVLLDGVDLFGPAPAASGGLSCRIYDTADGVPSSADTAERLRLATRHGR